MTPEVRGPRRALEDIGPLMHATDSAGVPWQGREFRPNPFAGDDGSVREATAAALGETDPALRPARVLDALRSERVLVPVVAHEHPGIEEVVAEDGTVTRAPAAHASHKSGDAQADACASAAMVSVRTRDGRAALPVFSSVDAMKAWNAHARPVPVEAPRAAQAAAVETDGLLVLDAGGTDPVLLGRPAVLALASGEEWTAPWADADLVAHVVRLLAPVPHLVGVRLEPGRSAETRVMLAVPAGLPRERAGEAVGAAQRLVAQDERLRAALDSLELAPVTVTQAPAGTDTRGS